MNKVIIIGRLTADPEYRVVQNEEQTTIATYRLAVDRAHGAEHTADFINVTVFGKGADFANKYLTKGLKVGVVGHLQTGSYKDQNGETRYTWSVIAEQQEFVESKKAKQTDQNGDGFVNAEELPFK